jgi:hypothetical protein
MCLISIDINIRKKRLLSNSLPLQIEVKIQHDTSLCAITIIILNFHIANDIVNNFYEYLQLEIGSSN